MLVPNITTSPIFKTEATVLIKTVAGTVKTFGATEHIIEHKRFRADLYS